jgi:hypothetical protein
MQSLSQTALVRRIGAILAGPVVVVAVIGACAGPGASPSTSGPAVSPAVPSSFASVAPSATAAPSATVAPSPTSAVAGFTTSGQAGSQKWSALSWAALPQETPLASISHIVTWRHGYAAYGAGIWQLADGNAWQPASPILADALIAESPAGLLVVSHASDPQSVHEV